MAREKSRKVDARALWYLPSDTSGFAILWRLLVFFTATGAVYWAFRELTVVLFAPTIEVVRPVVPTRDISPGSTVQLGVLVVNPKPMTGAAFVVASIGDGRQIEGPTVDVPSGDTTLVPVDVQLEREDQVIALVVFNGWRGVRRLQTFSGIRVGVTESDVAVDYREIPDTLGDRESFEVTVMASNHGTETVAVRAKLSIQSGPFQGPQWFNGDLAEIPAGDSIQLGVAVPGGALEPGIHFAQVIVETEEGVRRGGTRYPTPIVVSPPPVLGDQRRP